MALLLPAGVGCGGSGPSGLDAGEDVGPGQVDVRVRQGSVPIGGVEVALYDDGATALATDTTGADGAMLFAGVEPGMYRIEVEPPEPYLMEEGEPSQKSVTVASGSSEQLDFRLVFTVMDVEGRVYRTVWIGAQLWIDENLSVGSYRNGDPVHHAESDTEWRAAWEQGVGAWVFYDNLPSNADGYGRLYNNQAVADSRGICPEGWRVPAESDWQALEAHLGMSAEQISDLGHRGSEGGRLKSNRTEPAAHPRWDVPNAGATNTSGFSALPSGFRVGEPFTLGHVQGEFQNLGAEAVFWSSTERTPHIHENHSWGRGLYPDRESIYRNSANGFGFAVRCLLTSTASAEQP